MKKLLPIIALVLLTACGPKEADFKADVEPISIEEAREQPGKLAQVQAHQIDSPEGTNERPKPKQPVLPPSINLDIPFYAQAPDGDWSLPWKEACEEASITLAAAFVAGEDLSKEQFKEQVLGLVEWQKKHFGQYIDTSIERTAEMMERYLGHDRFEIIEEATPELIKRALAMGYPVVAPFAGRELGNPFYSGQGPYYHMLVIKGYDDKGNFIVNDVGTRRGHDFLYSVETVMDAMNDWGTLDIAFGKKPVLVVK